MIYLKIITFFLAISFSTLSYSQEKEPMDVLKARESIYETKFDKIAKNNLQILYKSKSFTFGDSYEKVNQKIGGGSKYSGEFKEWHTRIDESYLGDADFKIIFDDDYFFFKEGKLAYFIIRSNKFTVMLRYVNNNQGVINLKVGKSINILRKGLQKSFAQKLTKGDAYNDSFIINIGELKADSPIANNLIINVEKGGDRIKAINFYGY